MSDSNTKGPSIPSWQQRSHSEGESQSTTITHGTEPTTQLTHAELLEQARDFLKDESIQNAPRERKVTFLQGKGLKEHDIEELLGEDSAAPTTKQAGELKTVHDSNRESTSSEEQSTTQTQTQPQEESDSPLSSKARPPQRDVPPIITYPEFLLKPQKPPPLITVSRLVNAAYAFTGLATLTYGASKYIVDPMLVSLTEARHSLSSTTLADLEKLNTRLESTVSHVPYIARKSLDQHHHHHPDSEDCESITSDPTELFHRDIATQTTPNLSRAPSTSGTHLKDHLDPTTQQAQRLSSLHTTLSSLVATLDPQDIPYLPSHPTKKLHETISDFQTVLDRLEHSYNPFRSDYYGNTTYTPPSASSLTDSSNKSKTTGGATSAANKEDVAAKVRAEIRNLKGAFLSARNFPTAPRPVNAYGAR